MEAIESILPPDKPRSIFHFSFDGFGHARTLLFQEAWRSFSQATHLLIADPDWIPAPQTMNKADLDMDHDYFQFKIWDRNNITTRQSDWLMQHREGTYMVYRLHEVSSRPLVAASFHCLKELSLVLYRCWFTLLSTPRPKISLGRFMRWRDPLGGIRPQDIHTALRTTGESLCSSTRTLGTFELYADLKNYCHDRIQLPFRFESVGEGPRG